jgi:oligopeptide transport system substrate-binding protein
MYYVKNGEKISKGDLPLNELGAKAIDDYTLEVQLEKPCPFFLDLTVFVSYMPCREDFFKSRSKLSADGKAYTEMRYAATPADMLYNGPYKLSSWVKRTGLKMERNEHYWQPGLVKIHKINVNYISKEFRPNFALFQSGKIAFTSLNDETLKSALAAKLPLNTYNDGGFAYLEFNHRPKRSDRPDWQPIFANRNFRLAIQHAVKTDDIVNRIIGIPGYRIGNSLIPHCIGDKTKPWPTQFPLPPIKYDVKIAREYLEKARLELKLEKFPAIDLLVTDDPTSISQGEFLQYCLMRNLGLKLNLDLQTFKHRLQKQHDGDFDITFSSWGPDYNDPMTYVDLLWSKNENNHGAYNSAEYDALVTGAQNCADPVKRHQLFDQAQRHIRDHAVVVPLFERAVVYVVHKKLKGMTRDCLGTDPCLIHAWIEE